MNNLCIHLPATERETILRAWAAEEEDKRPGVRMIAQRNAEVSDGGPLTRNPNQANFRRSLD